MENYNLTFKEFFKSIQIIHFALITGVILFVAITFYLHHSGLDMADETGFDFAFNYFVPIFTIFGIVASNFLFKQRLKSCVKKPNLKEKLFDYRSALILKFALLEGPSFFIVIAYFLTGKLFYLGFMAILIAVFITYRPTKEKPIMDLELSHSEKQLIYDPNAIID